MADPYFRSLPLFPTYTFGDVAIDGLVPDTLGRRFRLSDHPRFAQVLAAGQAMRFEPDSPLPDPYDGLVAHQHAIDAKAND